MKNSKNLKYGSLAVAYTAVVIIAVILLNVAVSAIGSSFHSLFYVDMTSEQLFEISDTTDYLFNTTFSRMTEDEKDGFKIKISFLVDENTIKNTSATLMKQIYEMAKLYEQKYSFISIDYIEPDKNPEKVQKYTIHSVSTSAASLNETDVIIEGPNDKYVIVPYKNFFKVDSGTNDYLFDVENRMTGTILQLYSSNAIAYLTTGHGEDNALPELRELLAIAGYVVEEIDLTKQDFDYTKGKLVIINAPKTDFGGINDPVNEIEKLAKFVNYTKLTHHMMVFLDNENIKNDNLSELTSLIKDYGISYNQNTVTEAASNALSDDRKVIDASYITSEASKSNSGGLGHSFVSNLTSLGIKTLVKNACTMKIEKVNSASLKDDYYYDVILTTSAGATATDLVKSDMSYDAPNAPLMVIHGRDMVIDSKVTYTSYVIAGASSSIVSDEYLSKYGNRDIIYSAIRAMSLNSVDPEVTNISYKQYNDSGLSITEGEQIFWTVTVTTFAPIVLLAIGAVVFVRRRHR